MRRGYIPCCGKVCGGVRRQSNKSLSQKKEEKQIYDMKYREVNREYRKKQRAEYFKKTYDKEDAAKKRKLTMARHVEYCRSPEYKEWKKQYDEMYRAKQVYGEYWESFILLMKVEREALSRMDWTEIRRINGTLNKHQQRRRDYERLNSNKSKECPMGNA